MWSIAGRTVGGEARSGLFGFGLLGSGLFGSGQVGSVVDGDAAALSFLQVFQGFAKEQARAAKLAAMAATATHRPFVSLGAWRGVLGVQGYLAHKKHPPRRTIQKLYAWDLWWSWEGGCFLWAGEEGIS